LLDEDETTLLARAARRELNQAYGHAIRMADGANLVFRVIKNSDFSWSLYGADPESGLRLSDDTMMTLVKWVIKITGHADFPSEYFPAGPCWLQCFHHHDRHRQRGGVRTGPADGSPENVGATCRRAGPDDPPVDLTLPPETPAGHRLSFCPTASHPAAGRFPNPATGTDPSPEDTRRSR
jgi:hypothetical protein